MVSVQIKLIKKFLTFFNSSIYISTLIKIIIYKNILIKIKFW
jgi:hypothetical protein